MTFWFIGGLIAWAIATIALFVVPIGFAAMVGDYDWFVELNTAWRSTVRTGIIVVGLSLGALSGAGLGTTIADHTGPGIPADGCYQIKRTLIPSVVSTGKVTVVSENAVPEFYSIPCPGGS